MIDPLMQENPSKIAQQYNNDVKFIAKDMAARLQDSAFRDFIKQEALKSFDGDYDILLSTVISHLNGTENQDYARRTNQSGWDSKIQKIYNEIINEFPGMQVSVQVNADQWNTANYIPPVVYLSADYDEATTDNVKGYKADGSTVQLDARKAPAKPVVVVSLNERTMINPNGGPPDVPTPCHDCGEGTGSEGGGSPPPMGPPVMPAPPAPLPPVDPDVPLQWYRQNYVYETITMMKFGNIGSIEGWPAGAPEIRVYVYEQDYPNDSTKTVRVYKGEFEPPHRSDINDKWWDCSDDQMHLWRWYSTVTVFKYGFYEYDDTFIDKEDLKKLGDYVNPVLDAVGVANTGTAVVKAVINVVSIFLPMKNHKSEYIGQILMSANNSRTTFGCPGGDFQFVSVVQ